MHKSPAMQALGLLLKRRGARPRVPNLPAILRAKNTLQLALEQADCLGISGSHFRVATAWRPRGTGGPSKGPGHLPGPCCTRPSGDMLNKTDTKLLFATSEHKLQLSVYRSRPSSFHVSTRTSQALIAAAPDVHNFSTTHNANFL